MKQFRHGYTNETRRYGAGLVQKTYTGDDAERRAELEVLCLGSLRHRMPVPHVVRFETQARLLTMREVPGSHGQDHIEAGHASVVLGLLGSLLAHLQQIDPAAVPGLPGNGEVIVHGDYGPQNVLVEGQRISALLDWEFAHVGHPIEDLAWVEWIVRMHHASSVDALAEFFRAVGREPSWPVRQAAMVQRCQELLRSVEASGLTGASHVWRKRIAVTEAWVE